MLGAAFEFGAEPLRLRNGAGEVEQPILPASCAAGRLHCRASTCNARIARHVRHTTLQTDWPIQGPLMTLRGPCARTKAQNDTRAERQRPNRFCHFFPSRTPMNSSIRMIVGAGGRAHKVGVGRFWTQKGVFLETALDKKAIIILDEGHTIISSRSATFAPPSHAPSHRLEAA